MTGGWTTRAIQWWAALGLGEEFKLIHATASSRLLARSSIKDGFALHSEGIIY